MLYQILVLTLIYGKREFAYLVQYYFVYVQIKRLRYRFGPTENCKDSPIFAVSFNNRLKCDVDFVASECPGSAA